MPWTARSFAKHNHKLKGKALSKAASMATAMVREGVDEGIAIATANKRAKSASEHSDKRRKALYGD